MVQRKKKVSAIQAIIMDIGIKKAMNGYLGRQDASKGVSKIVLPFLRQDHSHSALLTLLFNEHVTVPPRLLLKFLDHIATYTARRLLTAGGL